MKITLPSTVGEMKLGQLVALSHIAELGLKKGEFTEADNKRCETALGDITGLSIKYVRTLTKETMVEINKHLIGSLYIQCLAHVPAILNEQYEYHTKVLSIKDSRSGLMKRFFPVKHKVENYSMGNPAKLPANIWQMLLDGVIRRIEKSPAEKPYLIWREIPIILASTAWGAKESYYTKDLSGQPVVDFRRINRVREELLELDLTTALKATAFFLTSTEHFLKGDNLPALKKKFHIQSSNPPMKEKSTVKNGDGLVT